MPQIKLKAYAAMIAAALALMGLTGCGTSENNSKSSFSADSLAHGADWVFVEHKNAAQAEGSDCAECHGSALDGGIADVSCSSCHLGGPYSMHPEVWGQLTPTSHGPYAAENGSAGCANAACHGADLAGVTGSGPSCSSCHMGGPTSVHPLDWDGVLVTKHAEYVSTVRSFAECATVYCHGVNLEGVAGSGHACARCH